MKKRISFDNVLQYAEKNSVDILKVAKYFSRNKRLNKLGINWKIVLENYDINTKDLDICEVEEISELNIPKDVYFIILIDMYIRIKSSDVCPKCNRKLHHKGNYCEYCGCKL